MRVISGLAGIKGIHYEILVPGYKKAFLSFWIKRLSVLHYAHFWSYDFPFDDGDKKYYFLVTFALNEASLHCKIRVYFCHYYKVYITADCKCESSDCKVKNYDGPNFYLSWVGAYLRLKQLPILLREA